MQYQFEWSVIGRHYETLVSGALLTLQLTATTIVVGFVLAVLCAGLRTSGPTWIRILIGVYVEIIRNTPFLVQLLIVFFGLPSIGLRLSANQAAVLAMTINFGAYGCEIIRSGIDAVPFGQLEAGRALSLSRLQVFHRIVFPQAIRTCYPALASQFTLVMLGSSVASAIGTDELSAVANILQSQTFRSFEIYAAVTLIYLCLAIAMRFVLALVYRLLVVRSGLAFRGLGDA